VSAPFPSGSYRRRLRIVTEDDGVVVGALEDDFHYFTVRLGYDGERVLAVDAESRRWPWTTCPGAAAPLRALVGMPLSRRCLAVGDWTDPRRNCTHMFDLAGLAVAHAARGGPPGTARQYDVAIPAGAQAGGRHEVRLWRDGEPTLRWVLDGRACVDPPPYSTTRWRGGFLRWADRTLPPDDAEAAIVLRRACDIGMGRGMDLDAVPRALDLLDVQGAICHTMQPGVVEVSLRNRGTTRDFDADPDRLLADWP
jgi:Protein of unknown function (DUF2889)